MPSHAPTTTASRQELSTERTARSSRTYSRVIGAMFLLGFVFYGVGFGLVSSVTSAPDFLAALSANQTTLVLGAFLMLLNTVTDIGKGVLFFPILESHGKRTALTYLAAMIVEVVLLDVGVLCLLGLLPLSGQPGLDAGVATTLGSIALQSNAMAYQIGEMTLGLGGLVLCSVLFRNQLIPRWLAVWGLAGYAIFVLGTVAELFGIHIGVVLAIPGGLFEVTLGFWLLVKAPAARDAAVASLATAGVR